jgi:hypothetical protein
MHQGSRRKVTWSLTSVAEVSALNMNYGRTAHGTSHSDER